MSTALSEGCFPTYNQAFMIINMALESPCALKGL